MRNNVATAEAIYFHYLLTWTPESDNDFFLRKVYYWFSSTCCQPRKSDNLSFSQYKLQDCTDHWGLGRICSWKYFLLYDQSLVSSVPNRLIAWNCHTIPSRYCCDDPKFQIFCVITHVPAYWDFPNNSQIESSAGSHYRLPTMFLYLLLHLRSSRVQRINLPLKNNSQLSSHIITIAHLHSPWPWKKNNDS